MEQASLEKIISENLAKKIKIIKGKYFSPSMQDAASIGLTENLNRIERETQFHFWVDNGIVNRNDPDPDNFKNLSVKYSYNSEDRQKNFEEGKWSLP